MEFLNGAVIPQIRSLQGVSVLGIRETRMIAPPHQSRNLLLATPFLSVPLFFLNFHFTSFFLFIFIVYFSVLSCLHFLLLPQ